MLKKIFILIIPIIFVLVSCGIITTEPHDINKSIKSTDSGVESANQHLDQLANAVKKQNLNYDSDNIYISNTSIERKNTDFLPPVFMHRIEVDQVVSSTNDISGLLNDITGYPVLMDVSAVKSLNLRIIQNRGNLIDLLNNICARTNLSWKFVDDKIVISDVETKTWFLHALPGDVVVNDQLTGSGGISGGGGTSSSSSGSSSASTASSGSSGGSSSGGGSGQSSVQTTQFVVNGTFWGNIETTIKSMLSTRGSVNIIPSTSSVTVTDVPSVVLRVGNFIDQQNLSLKRQVQIDVQVLAVNTNSNDNYGINWNVALSGAAGTFVVNGTPGANSSGSSSTSSSTGGVVPVFTPSVTTQSFSIAGAPGTSFNGVNLIIQALSTIAKVSLVTSASATTLNDQPVPVEFVDNQGYVSNISNTLVAQTGSQNSLSTGTITSGFLIHILPNIEDNGTVNLQLSVSISQLTGLSTFGVPGQQVQLPTVSEQDTMQKVTLHSGETYVLSGFDENLNSVTNTGIGGAMNWLLGGGISTSHTRGKMVILVTPKVL